MIFNVRHELTSYDLAYALALEAEVSVDPENPTAVSSWAVQMKKKEVREIARDRLKLSGEPEGWPPLEGDRTLEICRGVVNNLWPEGA